jgi:8-amino-7-oxononanoate synthase
MPVLDDLRADLTALESAGLLRRPVVLDGPRGPVVRLDGREVVVFCSNDYLGLAADQQLRTAVCDAALEHGVGAGASRLISGTDSVHRAAERALAALVALPDALLFSSGYAANAGALSSLLTRGDVAFSDRLNHASLIDGLRLSRAAVHIYEHGDTDHLHRLLRAHRGEGRRAWIVTDAVFSMDGDLAPLVALRALADDHNAGLYVDEAHSLGVLGGGRGLCAELGARPDALLGTLSKAAGMSGAFVAGAPELRRVLENRARSYIYSTAVSPALAGAIPTAVQLILACDQGRERLRTHAKELRRGLAERGWPVDAGGVTPIVPLQLGTPERAMQLSARLLERGFFVQGIRPPTVPEGTSRLRIVVTAAHTEAQVGGLLDAFTALR